MKPSRRLGLLLAFIAFFIFSSCVPKRPQRSAIGGPPVSHRYRQGGFSFRIQFPRGWKVSKKAKKMDSVGRVIQAFTAISPKEDAQDPFREQVAVLVVNPSRAEKSTKKKKKGRARAVNRIRETGERTLGPYMVRWFASDEYEAKDGGVMLKQIGFHIDLPTRIIRIGFVGEAAQFEKYRSVVWKVVNSINLTPP